MIDDAFARVRASPDDVQARLVLADALTDAGDPRGAFITLQCHLADLLRDPDAPEWEARKREEQALLAAHRDTWLAGDWGRLRFEFRRGLVEHVSGECSEIVEHAAALVATFPLLRSVKFDEWNLDAAPFARFVASPLKHQLSELELNASEPLLDSLRGLPALRALRLSGRDVYNAVPLASLPLRALTLEGTRLGSRLPTALAPSLKNLTIIGDAPGVDGADRLIAHLTSLETLVLADLELGDEGLQALSRWFKEGLRALDLHTCRLGAASATTLGALQLKSLRRLDVRSNRIGKAIAKVIALPSLVELSVRDCALKDTGFAALAVRDVSRLEVFDVRDDDLTDASVPMFTRARFAALKMLNVNRNRLSADGVASITRTLENVRVYGANQLRPQKPTTR